MNSKRRPYDSSILRSVVAAALATLMAAPAAAAPEPTPPPGPAPWSAVTLSDSSIDLRPCRGPSRLHQDYVPLIDSLTFASSLWTGSVAGCDPGSVPASVRDDLLAAVNFYRALADLTPVTRDSGLDADAQAAALIMDANAALSHQPPSPWDCWTQSGYDGAANSNLYLFPPGQTDFLIEASKGFRWPPSSIEPG